MRGSGPRPIAGAACELLAGQLAPGRVAPIAASLSGVRLVTSDAQTLLTLVQNSGRKPASELVDL
ncbi:MAG: hypothetical protein BGP03_05870 [Pseudonocardia sp. 73-21]|nr:MAG: hypothetical protein BGP03_05870 [Pseudonocardia sp. 73-21]